MSFLYPAALWVAGLLPVVVLLYLRRLRRRAHTVSTLLFWQQALGLESAPAVLGALRHPISLVLQLLIFILLLLAAAHMRFEGSLEPRSTAVVLDARARMQPVFEKALAIARSLAAQAGPAEEIAMIDLEGPPRILSVFSRDPRALRGALGGLTPSDAGGSLPEAVDLAQNLLHSRPGRTRLVVISDRVDPSLKEADQIAVGTAGGNLGITKLSARPLPASPQTWQLFTEIANFGASAKTAQLSFFLDGKLFDSRNLALAAGASEAVIADLPAESLRQGKGRVEARLAGSDALKADDSAFAALPVAQTTEVLLVSPGNPFLEQALKANPAINLEVLTPDAWKESMGNAFDVVVFDGPPPAPVALEAFPKTNFLFFGASPFGKLEKSGRVGAFEIAQPENPLLWNVKLDTSALSASFPIDVPKDGKWRVASPVTGPAGPLITTLEGVGGSPREAIFGFGVSDSNLPLRAAFPILLSNTVQWLAGNEKDAARDIAAGSVPELAPGEKLADPAGTAGSRALRRAGLYEIRSDAVTSRWISVNIDSPAESDLRNASTSGTLSAPWITRLLVLNVWQWIALAALILLLVEWRLHHRRVTE